MRPAQLAVLSQLTTAHEALEKAVQIVPLRHMEKVQRLSLQIKALYCDLFMQAKKEAREASTTHP